MLHPWVCSGCGGQYNFTCMASESSDDKKVCVVCYELAKTKGKTMNKSQPQTELEQLRIANDNLEAENTRLREKRIDEIMQDAKLLSLNFNSGSAFEIAAASPIFGVLGEWCVTLFKNLGAENFVEQEMHLSPALGGASGGERFTITILRKKGKTPGDLLREANEKIRQLEDKLKDLEQ